MANTIIIYFPSRLSTCIFFFKQLCYRELYRANQSQCIHTTKKKTKNINKQKILFNKEPTYKIVYKTYMEASLQNRKKFQSNIKKKILKQLNSPQEKLHNPLYILEYIKWHKHAPKYSLDTDQ